MVERVQFYSEAVYSKRAVWIQPRLRKAKDESTRWSVDQVISELIRVPENCPHVDVPSAPASVYGYPVERLREYESALYELARRQTETYVRRGREHVRQVKDTSPILLAAVASYPEPRMNDTPQRRRWIGLVVDAARDRWGKRFRSAIAHCDESYYHLHLLVDNVGATVKKLHMGHALATLEPEKSRRGEAYRIGCVNAQDWYYTSVGEPMGWARMSQAPRPRVGRVAALRNRQHELEVYEQELDEKARLLDEIDAQLAETAARLEKLAVLTSQQRHVPAGRWPSNAAGRSANGDYDDLPF